MGRTLRDASKVTREQIVRELGGLPQASQHAGALAADALQAALKEVANGG
jgi:hypothetical protein